MEGIPTYGEAVANLPGQSNYSGAASSDIQKLAPLATTYHSSPQPIPYANYQQKTSSPGVMQAFTGFWGNVGKEIGHLTGAAANFVAQTSKSMITAPIKMGKDLSNAWLDNNDLSSVNTQINQYSARMDNLNSLYKEGKISAKDYKAQLQGFNTAFLSLSKEAMSVQSRAAGEYSQSKTDLVNTAADLVTILTAGFGKAASTAITGEGLVPMETQTAGKFIASQASRPFFDSTENIVARIATNPKLMNQVIGQIPADLERASAEVVAQGEKMTSAQIARATAANIALKYPITYSFIQPSAQDFYAKLDDKQYGQALQSLAKTFGIVLAGGLIPYAFKYGGKSLKRLSGRAFGETSFWDELSRYYKGGTPSGFRDAADNVTKGMSPADAKQFIRDMSAVEATNMAKTGGDAVAAARMVADTQRARYGFDVSQLTHEEELRMMLTDAQVRREADALSQKTGKSYVLGRVDQRNLQDIADTITQPPIEEGQLAPRSNEVDMTGAPDFLQPENKPAASDHVMANTLGITPEEAQTQRLAKDNPRPKALSQASGPLTRYKENWAAWKANNPTQAATYNKNFDKQITSLMYKYRNDEASLKQAITEIKAGYASGDIPEDISKKWAKQGYIAIESSHPDVVFKEGTGVLKSSFAAPGDFWTKTVKPVPVLSHIGTLFTKMGLSPNASTQRVYQYFNDYLTKELQSAKVGIQGDTPEQTTDLILKKASEYIKSNRGGYFDRTPIYDLRQMTTKDWMRATGRSEQDAKAIQKAVAISHIKVPLAVKGMGDKSVDVFAYGAKPVAAVARRYMRLQAGLRFAINPFFQYMRVIPKNEILTETHGGGFIKSIFMGRSKQMGDIRNGLREAGFFAPTSGFTTSGEATDFAGSVGVKGVKKQLLPMQERSISGLVDSMAQKEGMGWQDFIKTYPDRVADTIDGITGYAKSANFINSPLARTLNVAIFPFRFDAKVVMAMSKALANSGLLPRVAFVNGLLKAHDFFTSPEGQAWYAQNSEIIGLFKYITPIGTLNEAFNSLLPGKDHSLGNFGELGGLPFGWIPQLLDAEGLTNFNQPGVNPKTGQPYTKYIPVTSRGQVAVAIQDLLGGLFSYPGTLAGLPSKTKATGDIGRTLTESSSKTDFKTVTPTLSPAQQQQAQGIQQAMGTSSQSNPIPEYHQVAATQIPGPFPTSATNPPRILPKPASSRSSSSKKKKAQFTPQLLPGQTTLGQI